MNTALPEDIAEFAAVAAKRFARLGGPHAALHAETTGPDSTAAMKLVIDRLGAQPESTRQDSLNRALSLDNQQLAETRPRALWTTTEN